MSIFLTVISGILIFVIGQFILKLVLEPIVSFKEHLGMTSALFLKEQGKITNGSGEESIIKEIKTLAALLLAKKKAIPYYNFMANIFCLPTQKNIMSATQEMNLIANLLKTHQQKNETEKVCKSMHKISELLDITMSY